MPKYKFWYKKEVEAKHLQEALRKEKSVKIRLDSVIEEDEKNENLAPAIGFKVDDYEDYDSNTD